MSETRAGDVTLLARIGAAIDAAGGSIGFAEFMELALYAPDGGYYAGGRVAFDEGGDFTTAPESSPLFAGCIARQCAEILEAMEGDTICEVGAGSGALAADLLTALAGRGMLPDRYVVVERSPALAARQRERIEGLAPDIAGRVAWEDEIPRGLRGVVLGNEVLDAIPASRFRMRGGRPRECRVARDGEDFRWVEAPADDVAFTRQAESVLATLDHVLPEGYVSELAPSRQEFVADLASRLDRGVALLADYGYGRAEYYHPQRAAGTLCCFHRHRAHDDPLVLVGEQDISVHVDFTAIAEAAVESELRIAGFTTQAEFLLATGLLDACRDLEPGSRAYVELTGQIKRLTLPGQMGEAIKVMALARGFDAPLSGFTGRDLRGRL